MMLIVCSNNRNVLQRWQSVLAEKHQLQATESLQELKPLLQESQAVVILHDALFVDSNINALTDLLKQFSSIRFLVLADTPSETTAFKLLHSGAYGYSNTYISPKLLSAAVAQIIQGEVWMGKRLTRYLSECLLEDINNEETENTAREAEGFLTHLTFREKEVASRIAHGCSNKCVAKKLNISERTVKAHLSSIFQKTGIRDRVHLALILNSHKYD